ncbi:thioredoxin family protein [Brevundimonas nasdae]|uniref:Thioredoxin family protein n=1 Tax=Brevundimonas nasdae TaxID=172043 RepID=A0ABX8TKT3_9CAUL|nr:thioredoxin family protein [Brevundimonas nasdae]QYC09734.1 thioredoxin family protein [Brevundimonas nasdae]QYC12522.1 thioredoxin family protein [Brevundimonas nasdae]
MLRRLFVVAASAALLAACQPQASAPAAENASAPAAAQEGLAPAFTLVDADGVQRSLADFRGKTVVLEWTNEGCPYVQKHYTGAMQALQREAQADGVVWLTIVSSAPGTQGFVEGDAARAYKAKHQSAYAHLLLDPTGEVGKLYGAKTTPDMRVIDAQGRLVFEGGIDDRPTSKVEDLEGANNFVRAALEDVKAERPVRTAFAQPYGCAIKYPETVTG